jgi:hypothetical protein
LFKRMMCEEGIPAVLQAGRVVGSEAAEQTTTLTTDVLSWCTNSVAVSVERSEKDH